MAQSVIGSLRVNLGLDSAEFSKGVQKTQASTKDLAKRFAVLGAAAASLATAIGAMAISSANEIDKTVKAARRLDSSVLGFRALEMAAGEAGVSLSSLTNDVQTMNREIAAGTKNAIKALNTLGLSAKDLEGLEADQKLALIADRIQEMGLDAGQATALLRDLGVRNREMVLALISGGDAFRAAREDVKSYGLALSTIETDSIEKANDQMGRLGIVTQYLGEQLALKIVPTLGAFAQVVTDSMRSGGLLRTVIDGLVDNLETAARAVASLTAWFGIRLVASMALARAGVLSLASVFGVLRAAIASTGFGILVIAAGEIVFALYDIVARSSSVVEALDKVYSVGKAVFLGVANTAFGLAKIVSGVASVILASFLAAFAEIGNGFDKLVNGINSAFKEITGKDLGKSNIGGALGGLSQDTMTMGIEDIKAGYSGIAEAGRNVANVVRDATASIQEQQDVAFSASGSVNGYAASLGGVTLKSNEAIAASRQLASEIQRLEFNANPLMEFNFELEKLNQLRAAGLSTNAYNVAVADLRDRLLGASAGARALQAEIQRLEFNADPIKEYNHELERLNELKGSGLSDGAYEKAVEDLNDRFKDVKSTVQSFSSSASSAFSSFLTGAKDAKDAVLDLIGSFLSQATSFGLNSLFGSIMGGITGFATGTPYAPGGLAMVGERGPELVNLPRGSQVLNASRTRDVMNGGGGTVRIMIEEAPGFAARVRTESRDVAVEVVKAGIGEYDRMGAPEAFQRIQNDPRRRG